MRRKTEYFVNGTRAQTKYFIGSYEEEITASDTRKIHYLPGGAVFIMNNQYPQGKMYYTYGDYLGSILAITDDAGTVLEEQSFDPWGRVRNVSDWTYTNAVGISLFDRGYTGHQHLYEFGIINMNGRLYDPVLGRMLSPDLHIQAPDLVQNYNRYSYVLNNPLIYTDPDGEFWHLIIGAAIGGISNLIAHRGDIDNFWQGLGYFGVGAAAGALGAGVGTGISSALAGGSFGAGFIGSSAAKIATTSFISGAAIGGGSGFASGFSTGFGNSLMDGKTFGESLWKGTQEGLVGGFTGGLLGGIGSGINALRDNRSFWTGQEWEVKYDFKLPPTWSSPTGDLPIHNQNSSAYGCTEEAFESILDYKMINYEIPNTITGTDARLLAEDWGFVVKKNYNDIFAVGMQMNNGYPSILTYTDGISHSVGINRIQYLQRPRLLSSQLKTKIIIQVMNPLKTTYQNIEMSKFTNGVIRTIYEYHGFVRQL